MHDIGKMTRRNFLLNKRKRSVSPGGNPTNHALSQLDRNCLNTLIEYTASDHVPYTRAYRLVRIGGGTFDNVSE